jgi:hypothetical protein
VYVFIKIAYKFKSILNDSENPQEYSDPLDFELIPKADYVYSPEMKEHDYAAYAVFFYY